MTTLRIHFEVEEKHVGKCLVALEGMGKNLNFEIVAQVPFDRNAPGKAPKAKSMNAETIVGLLRANGGSMEKQAIYDWVRAQGYKAQGLVTILLSLHKRKIAKKVGSVVTLLEGK